MTVTEFPTPAEKYPDQEQYNRVNAQAIRSILHGKSNNVLDVTLATGGATSTTVTDARIGINTVALCIPTTSNAAALTPPYRDFSSPVNGSMSLIHAADADSDNTFKVILIG